VRAADGNRGPTLNSPSHAGGEDLVTTVVKLYREAPEQYPLLPTPTARDWKSTASNVHGKNSRPLNEVVAKLYNDRPEVFFKTPTANLGSNGAAQHPDKRKANGHGPTLADEVCFLLNVTPEDTQTLGPHSPVEWWGKFGPAVRRWETLTGKAAPVPVIRGPRGGIKLSPRFCEWLMGLPDGWVTAVPDVSVNEQISRIGNGVVPAQAYAAFKLLLETDERRQGQLAAGQPAADRAQQIPVPVELAA